MEGVWAGHVKGAVLWGEGDMGAADVKGGR